MQEGRLMYSLLAELILGLVKCASIGLIKYFLTNLVRGSG